MTVMRGIEKDVHGDIKAAQRMRLRGWRAWLSCLGSSAILVSSLGAIGRLDLFYPIEASMIAIGFAIVLKWQLRRFAWFWIVVSIFTAGHVAVISSVHWTDKWIPAPEITGIAVADFILMLVTLDILARLIRATGQRRAVQ